MSDLNIAESTDGIGTKRRGQPRSDKCDDGRRKRVWIKLFWVRYRISDPHGLSTGQRHECNWPTAPPPPPPVKFYLQQSRKLHRLPNQGTSDKTSFHALSQIFRDFTRQNEFLQAGDKLKTQTERGQEDLCFFEGCSILCAEEMGTTLLTYHFVRRTRWNFRG